MDTNDHWATRRTGIVPTPPPSIRRSKRSVLDEASRPTAPEPSPEISFTSHGVAVGRHLVDVHNHYRDELQVLRGLLDQVTEGITTAGQARSELNQFTLRANNWALGGVCQRQCVSYTDHHTAEDSSIFPHLRTRQRSLQEVLDRLDVEHNLIGEVLEEIDAALVHLARNPTDIGPVSEAVDLLTDTLLSHFAYEERELLAPLAQHGFYSGQVTSRHY
ncbi:hemerythrin domain-containing protein [Streptomyces sp. 3213.3]|uniref:hemerythrin domain-containing protein n=1 Tax=Streptomyces sp. 3213.3 TaxID=1855348 RepID=UPI00135C2CE8|nr:hemerythrin domain-containing protein [Streptomyces sp. 3213.3]